MVYICLINEPLVTGVLNIFGSMFNLLCCREIISNVNISLVIKKGIQMFQLCFMLC